MARFSELTTDARNELWALLALRHAYGIGPLRAKRLWESFGSGLAAAEACLNSPAAWSDHVPLPTARKFSSGQWREKAKLEWAAVRACGLPFLNIGDPDYPELLRDLPDAPLLLYYTGDISLLRGPSIAVVGARNCTREGIAVSAFFSRDLSRAGLTVISGMARGVDRAAHLAGLEGPGSSIGVLGTGVDVPYPTCNSDLFSLMSRKGLLLSEYAPGTPASPKHFPVRNRIISGLSQGTLVVEAADRSGSLITARLALEQNREVFAVPGHTMAAVSGGCRRLIRQGAKAVFNADDILSELAPLLTLETQKALGARQGKTRDNAPMARNRSDEPYDRLLAEAIEVLPQGELPWIAPRQPVQKRAEAAPAPVQNPEHPSAPVPAPNSAPNPTLNRKRRGARENADARTPAPSREPEVRPGPDESELTDDERGVLSALSGVPLHIDDIAEATGMDVAKLSALLTLMEIRGLLRHMPGMLYDLVPRP